MAASTEREIQSTSTENLQSVEGDVSEEQFEKNFNRIQGILTKCTEKCFAPVRFETISSCLSEVREKNPTVFNSIVPQLIEHLKVNMKQELDLMFEQENLICLCNKLDEITKISRHKQAAWRPSGLPSEDIKDHVLSVKLEFQDKLKEKLKQLQDENEELKKSAILTKSEIREAEERIILKHSELQTIATACDELTSSNDNEDSKYSLQNIIRELER